MFGTTEIILIVAAVFLLFGASRLPKLAKSLGQSRKAFKEGMEEMENEINGDSKVETVEPPQIKNVTEKINPVEKEQTYNKV